MSYLLVDSAAHAYAGSRALNGVSFSLDEGRIGCLMGPSGSGKTTALLCIAGLERLVGGRIVVGGRVVSGEGAHVAPEKRRVGMVFQDFALFPHLSVEGNIAFAARRLPPQQRQKDAGAILELCGLRDLKNARPHELSGGEQQRVALARALVARPDLLLLDEPFSCLDAALHEKLSRQTRDILKARGQTTLLVTHNQNEGFLLADIGGVINEGAICQWGKMEDLYHRPSCAFVAGFVGDSVLLGGTLLQNGGVQTALGALAGNAFASNPLLRPGEAVKALLRPDDVQIGEGEGVFATVTQRAFRGATTLYSLRLANGEEVVSVLPSRRLYAPGEQVRVTARARHLTLFPALEGAA